MNSDIEIARAAKLKPVTEIAKQLGVATQRIEQYGQYKAKLPLDLIDLERVKPVT